MLSPMADSRVSAAVSHWAPRFIANGVDYNDFVRVTSAIGSWDSWCEQWCRPARSHEQLGRAALAAGRERSAGAHLAQAAVYYHFAKFMFVDDLDQMRAAHLTAVRVPADALPFLDPPGERVEIPFDGAAIAGVLRRPPGPGPHPVVILIPGLDSAKEEFRPTEELFLSRGLATLSVDGPGQGEAEYDLAIRGDWEVPGSAIIDAACRGCPASTRTGSGSGESASAATTPPGWRAVTPGSGPASRCAAPYCLGRRLGPAARAEPRRVHRPVEVRRQPSRPGSGRPS